MRISDELWAVLEPLLPPYTAPHRWGAGRPRVPDRRCADAIFTVLRVRCRWGALDRSEICKGPTARSRFQEWAAAGVFQRLREAGGEQFEELRDLDWDWLATTDDAPLGGDRARS